MTKQYNESLARFGLPEFKKEWGAFCRGIEKESLRVRNDGQLSKLGHPLALGSALTNPYITTDFSEALLEFITPVTQDPERCLQFLAAIHSFTYRNMNPEEILWACSMPCPLGDEEDIPIAHYGSSNIGRLKTLYRMGLSYRYGRRMQIISGIHYNFSMPEVFWPAFQKIRGDKHSLQEFRTSSYLHLIRNFHRFSWLLLYLFGASPVASKSLVKNREHSLEEFDEHSFYLPFATCLRMGDLGYRSEAQRSIFVCYNELDSYIESLSRALHTPLAEYEKIGQKVNGAYRQINTNLLQLENEFYSSIRPKRVVNRGERPITALTRDGVEYVEVRLLDLNPFLPVGIDAEQIRFLDAFLLYCLLADSPPCNEKETLETSQNTDAVVNSGREPGLLLQQGGHSRDLRTWAEEILAKVTACAVLLDESLGIDAHVDSLAKQLRKVHNPEMTPSGQTLKIMRDGELKFSAFAMTLSKQHREYFTRTGIDATLDETLKSTSAASLLKREEIESADRLEFDAFLEEWNKF